MGMTRRYTIGDVCQHRNGLYGRGVVKKAELINGRMKYLIRLNNIPKGSTSPMVSAWENQLSELNWH